MELKNEILKKRTIRVGKCNGYDRYIRVKILAGCGKKFGGTDNFPKMNTFLQDLQKLLLKYLNGRDLRASNSVLHL